MSAALASLDVQRQTDTFLFDCFFSELWGEEEGEIADPNDAGSFGTGIPLFAIHHHNGSS